MKPKKKTQKPEKQEPRSNVASDFISSGDLAVSVLKKMEESCSETPARPGLDLLPGSLAPGTLTVICSLPHLGKSAYLVNLALELLDKKRNTAVFLPEYSAEEFTFKAICARAEVNYSKALLGSIPREKWPALTRAAGQLLDPGLFLSRSCKMTAADIAKEAKLLADVLKKDGRRLDAVIVDSLNFLDPGEYYSEPLESLENLARQLGTAVICSFDLRETPNMRKGNVRLGDARLAGIDEHYADQIYHLHRPEYYDRSDPTLKGMAVLRRLYPYLGGRQEELNLRFNRETLAFSVIKPVCGIVQEEELF